MNDQDADRLSKAPRADKHPTMRCGLCNKLPTCPQLKDEVWHAVWTVAKAMGLVDPPCTCIVYRTTLQGSTPVKAATHYDDPHCLRNKKRELLCFECTETCLGRQLELNDLESCVANYAHYVMQRRMSTKDSARHFFAAGVAFEASGDIAGYGDLAEPGGYDRAIETFFEELWKREP